MPALNSTHIAVLQPLINPFQRSPTKTIETDLKEGEGHNDEFLNFIHDGINNNPPIQYTQITVTELTEYEILRGGSCRHRCFLWVIDAISIKIIWEGTRNVLRSSIGKPFVCHTNITACSQAYIGGEMYFCEDGNIYVNFKSDRYGRPETEEKKHMAIQYIRDVGYQNVVPIEL
ncbi:MAG: hypothetical protein PHP04_07365 [Bacteroidales bacterium]|nr:hypothetical protein [Bacteroidales bacterium]